MNPTLAATPLDIAWLAGFYEGEGFCSTRGRDGYMRLGIEQVDPEPLHRVQALCGGNMRLRKRGEREIWTLILCGVQAREMAAAIYPHLSARRRAQLDPLIAGRRHYTLSHSKWGDHHGLRVVA